MLSFFLYNQMGNKEMNDKRKDGECYYDYRARMIMLAKELKEYLRGTYYLRTFRKGE